MININIVMNKSIHKELKCQIENVLTKEDSFHLLLSPF